MPRRWFAITLIALAIPLTAFGAVAVSTLPSGTTLADNFVQVGQQVVIDGDVQGDVVVFGQSVNVRGSVSGDVLGAAGDVTITGPVAGNVRVAGSTVTITGAVGKNVTVAAATLVIGPDATVGGTLVFAGSTLTLDGAVERHVDAWLADATVRGRVGGDLRLRLGGGGVVTFGPQANVGGNFAYTATHEATVADGAVIEGTTSYTPVKQSERSVVEEARIIQRIAKLFGLVLLGFVALTFARRSIALSSLEMRTRPGHAVLTGALTLFGGPLLALLLLLTIIGAPLAVLIGATWLILWLLGGVAVALSIGAWVVNGLRRWMPRLEAASVTWRFVIGAIVLVAVVDGVMGMDWWTSQPLLEWFSFTLRAFLACWGVGAIVLVLRRYMNPER